MSDNQARRDFLKTGAVLTLAGGVLTSKVNAQSQKQPEILAEIGRNHGHALRLSLLETVSILRDLQPEEKSVEVDIQGGSGHNHTVSMHYDNLLDILLGKKVILDSSEDAGHKHGVELSFEIES